MQNQNINLALKENSQILTLRKFAFKNHTNHYLLVFTSS